MSRTHLNAVRIRTEERGYIALYNAEQYKPQNKMFHFCKTFCSKITLVNTIQNVILNPI